MTNGNHRTLLVGGPGLENAKSLIAAYKQGKIRDMNPELWKAKKVVDSTLHPGMHFWCTSPIMQDDSINPYQILANQSSCPFECHASFSPIWWLPQACSHLA
jgi:hypothetical protein